MSEEMWLLVTIAAIGVVAFGGLWIALKLEKYL